MLENFGEGWCSRLLWGVVLFVNFTLLSYDKTCYQNLKMLIKVEALALCSSLSLFCELWALCDAVLKCLAVVQFHDFIPWWWQRSWAMLHAPPKNVGCCFQHPTTAMYPYPYNMSTPVCLFFTQLSVPNALFQVHCSKWDMCIFTTVSRYHHHSGLSSRVGLGWGVKKDHEKLMIGSFETQFTLSTTRGL